jgi:hypothetical protein
MASSEARSLISAVSFMIAVIGFLGYRWLTRGQRGTGPQERRG